MASHAPNQGIVDQDGHGTLCIRTVIALACMLGLELLTIALVSIIIAGLYGASLAVFLWLGYPHLPAVQASPWSVLAFGLLAAFLALVLAKGVCWLWEYLHNCSQSNIAGQNQRGGQSNNPTSSSIIGMRASRFACAFVSYSVSYLGTAAFGFGVFIFPVLFLGFFIICALTMILSTFSDPDIILDPLYWGLERLGDGRAWHGVLAILHVALTLMATGASTAFAFMLIGTRVHPYDEPFMSSFSEEM